MDSKPLIQENMKNLCVSFNCNDKVSVETGIVVEDRKLYWRTRRSGKPMLGSNIDDDDEGGGGGGGGGRRRRGGGGGRKNVKNETKAIMKCMNIKFHDNKRVNAMVLEKYGYQLVYGRCQSGKTDETLKMLCQGMAELNSPGILICREYKLEAKQHFWSFRGKVEKYNQMFGVKINIKVVFENMTKKEQKESYNKALEAHLELATYSEVANCMMNTERPSGAPLNLYIMMGNVAGADKIVSNLKNDADVLFCLAIDEVDTFVRGDYKNKVPQEELEQQFKSKVRPLIDAAALCVFVSATQLDTSVIIPDGAVPNVKVVPFGFNDVVEGCPMEYRSMHRVWWRKLRVHLEHENSIMLNAIGALQDSIDNNLQVPYNNDGMNYMLIGWHHHINSVNEKNAIELSEHPFTIKDETKYCMTFTTDQQGLRAFHKGKLVASCSSIKELMDLLWDQAWQDNCPISYMFGSRRVGRAANITDSSYKMYAAGTVYTQKDDDMAKVYQEMSRLCGLSRKKDIKPQYVWSREDAINGVLDTIEANSAFMATIGKSSGEDKVFATTMAELVMPEARTTKKPSKTRAINTAPKHFSVRSPHAEPQPRAAAEPEMSPPPAPEVASELTPKDLYRLTKDEEDGCFKKWASGTNKIARFMQQLDPEKIYTKNEIKNLWRKINKTKLVTKQFTTFDTGSGGYGTIMKEVGNTYQMYPELVPHYRRFFGY